MLIGHNANSYSDGSTVVVDTNVLNSTINMQLLEEGTVYSLLYTSTPFVHREHIRTVAGRIKQKNTGVWDEDQSSLFELEDFQSIIAPDGVLIYPKLFRRSIDFSKSRTSQLDNLPDWLLKRGEATENDRVLIDESFDVNLSDLIVQNNDDVSLQVDILQMTFHER
jgi:hypothetical protein